jgi:uncharacterized protein
MTVEFGEDTTPTATGTASATDLDPTLELIYSDAVTPGSNDQEYTIIRTWSATDDSGNTTSADQLISVGDTTLPMLIVPADVIVENGDDTAPTNTGTATAVDLDSTLAIAYSDAITPGSNDQEYTITRIWSATDDSGNTTSADQLITIVDTIAPTLTVPQDVTVEFGKATTPSTMGTASATDADPTLAIAYSDAITPGSNDQEYTITRTWSATDDSGNATTADQLIAVVAPPIIPNLIFEDLTVKETDGAAVAKLAVQLTEPTTQTVTVDYTAVGDTATAGQDFRTVSGTLTFTPGTTQQTLSVSILGDRTYEATEQFGIKFSNVVNATLADSTTQITVQDNDLAPAQTFFNFQQSSRFQGNALTADAVEIGGLLIEQFFDESYYLHHHADVADAVRSGALSSGYQHFVNYGWREGRNPSSLYNEQFYLSQNADVAKAIADGAITSGLQHFLLHGHGEGREASDVFSQADYLTANPDVARAVDNGAIASAFEHYIEHGVRENRQPSLAIYNEAFYLQTHTDIADAVAAGVFANGFEHFVSFGQIEGRAPSSLFDEASYLSLNPDVKAAVAAGGFTSGFEHYAMFGRLENRLAI